MGIRIKRMEIRWGVVILGWGYVIYITGENLTILLYTLFLVLSSLL